MTGTTWGWLVKLDDSQETPFWLFGNKIGNKRLPFYERSLLASEKDRLINKIIKLFIKPFSIDKHDKHDVQIQVLTDECFNFRQNPGLLGWISFWWEFPTFTRNHSNIHQTWPFLFAKIFGISSRMNVAAMVGPGVFHPKSLNPWTSWLLLNGSMGPASS